VENTAWGDRCSQISTALKGEKKKRGKNCSEGSKRRNERKQEELKAKKKNVIKELS